MLLSPSSCLKQARKVCATFTVFHHTPSTCLLYLQCPKSATYDSYIGYSESSALFMRSNCCPHDANLIASLAATTTLTRARRKHASTCSTWYYTRQNTAPENQVYSCFLDALAGRCSQSGQQESAWRDQCERQAHTTSQRRFGGWKGVSWKDQRARVCEAICNGYLRPPSHATISSEDHFCSERTYFRSTCSG